MSVSRRYPTDFVGIWVVGTGTGDEVVMADSMRYTGTSAEIRFAGISSKFTLEFKGSFEERPVTQETPHIRADIYLNLDHAEFLISDLTELSGRRITAREQLPSAPDPREFRVGVTGIPRKDVPSTQLVAEKGEIAIPKWNMSKQNVRVFLDIEEDAEFGRVQLHVGTLFSRGNCSSTNRNISRGSVETCSGKLGFDEANIRILKSYLVHYGNGE